MNVSVIINTVLLLYGRECLGALEQRQISGSREHRANRFIPELGHGGHFGRDQYFTNDSSVSFSREILVISHRATGYYRELGIRHSPGAPVIPSLLGK